MLNCGRSGDRKSYFGAHFWNASTTANLPRLLRIQTLSDARFGGTPLISKSPQGAAQSLFAHVKAHDYRGAYAYVANASNDGGREFMAGAGPRGGSRVLTFQSARRPIQRVLD